MSGPRAAPLPARTCAVRGVPAVPARAAREAGRAQSRGRAPLGSWARGPGGAAGCPPQHPGSCTRAGFGRGVRAPAAAARAGPVELGLAPGVPDGARRGEAQGTPGRGLGRPPGSWGDGAASGPRPLPAWSAGCGVRGAVGAGREPLSPRCCSDPRGARRDGHSCPLEPSGTRSGKARGRRAPPVAADPGVRSCGPGARLGPRPAAPALRPELSRARRVPVVSLEHPAGVLASRPPAVGSCAWSSARGLAQSRPSGNPRVRNE